MLVRFSEDGEAAGTGAREEEDIIVRVRGVGGVRCVGGRSAMCWWEECDVLVGRKAKTQENPKFI